MERLEWAFVACIVASLLLGSVVAADVGTSFRTAGLAGPVSEQVTAETTGTTLRDGRLVVTASLENPTRYRLRLTGVFAQVSANDSRLAYGSHSFSDPVVVGPRSTQRVRYSVSLAPEGERRVRDALTDAGTPRLQARYSLRLGETALVVGGTTTLDSDGVDDGKPGGGGSGS